MIDLEALYASGSTLDAWGSANVPDEALIYKGGVSSQLRKIRAVADIAPQSSETYHPPMIVGHHHSKSVKLPVTCFRFTPYGQVSAYAFVRDNFHDIKVVVVSDSPITIPYPAVYQEWDQERYEHEVERYVGYTKERPAEGSDEWYSKGWSHGTILRRAGRIYLAGAHQSVYCEGINQLGLPEDTFKPYEYGMQSFVCEVGSYATVAVILEYVNYSIEKERYRRNQERHAAEEAAKK